MGGMDAAFWTAVTWMYRQSNKGVFVTFAQSKVRICLYKKYLINPYI
jgi:hypothetical protein